MGGKKNYIEMFDSFTEPFKCLTAVFQDNLHRPAPECLHSGFYWSKENDRGCGNWSYQPCKAPVKLAPQQTNTQFFYRLDALPVARPIERFQIGMVGR